MLAAALAGCGQRAAGPVPDVTPPGDDVETTTTTTYTPPPPRPDDGLADDRIEEKATTFDPSLVDRRLEGGWQVNASEAIIGLDSPMLLPDADAELLALRPSYRAAAEAARAARSWLPLLPSVNMIDGKAKQFDDGLYAALDLAYYRGLDGTLASHVALLRRIYEKVGPDKAASAYLAAGLSLAGVRVAVKDEASKARWLLAFDRNPHQSRPISFYTWSGPLADCFRFLRFFQGPIDEEHRTIAREIADVLKADPALMADYRKALAFYARLTNPTVDMTVVEMPDDPSKIRPRQAFYFFPSSTSHEYVLFNKLFPNGLPPGADLMRELIAAIRSGKVDLTPRPDSGWYDHQVYALETLLLPDRGVGGNKLLLTKAYKARLVEAFKATMTKRRDTHSRQLTMPTSAAPPSMSAPPIAPRLRLEPCPSYYLRTAQAYEFLRTFLVATVGEPALKSLHGLKEGGERPVDLLTELVAIRDLFYGFYLLDCEDIGVAPAFAAGELVDRDRCEASATAWLAKPLDDPDLAVDTRVAVAIYREPTRIWTTLGVRLARVQASYARPPKVRRADKGGRWASPEHDGLLPSHYLIAVDESAEVELAGDDVLTRAELRAACDANRTKEAIVKALSRPD